MDPKHFDFKLVDRALNLLSEFQKLYQFVIVRCTARPFMKKAAEIQEQVMAMGIGQDTIPR